MKDLQQKRNKQIRYQLQCDKYTAKKNIRQLKKMRRIFLKLQDGILQDDLFITLVKATDNEKKKVQDIKMKLKGDKNETHKSKNN